MALEVFFREDVRASVLGVTVAAVGAALATGTADPQYCRGVLDAARATCVAFRIPWDTFAGDLRALLDVDEHQVDGRLIPWTT